MAIILDTNIIFAASFSRDANHQAARDLLQRFRSEPEIVPILVLSEVFFLAVNRLSYGRAVQIFADTRDTFAIEPLTMIDMQRMEQVIRAYDSTSFDLADVSIMAVAERLNITRIATFDRRDFGIYRPGHVAQFTLLP